MERSGPVTINTILILTFQQGSGMWAGLLVSSPRTCLWEDEPVDEVTEPPESYVRFV